MSDNIKPVKTRMAPSPTGEFHIGSMRTLLYNYAFAKKNHGKFLLRIEDTDRERFVEGALDRTYQIIGDYGLNWDEGPLVGGPNEPYVQSQRLGLYKKYALELVGKGHAYYCFCTKERLDEMRKKQQENHLRVTKYDRHCLSLTPDQVAESLKAGVPYVIRMKVPSDRAVSYEDVFLGRIDVPSSDIEDQILLKSDGFPTYHLAVVVDDHLMGVTHILRGREWLPSTPKHVLLYEFLGWEMPVTGHFPVLKEVGSTKKMSKRFGDVAAADFLANGYLPEALLNFIMLLGWNPGTEKEIFSLDEFVQAFSLERIHKTDLVAFDREKLSWFNGYYIRQLSDEILYDKISDWAKKWDVNLSSELKDRMFAIRILALIKDRMKILSDFKELSIYFFTDPMVDPKAFSIHSGERWQDILQGFEKVYAELEESFWAKENLDKVSHKVLEDFGYSPKEAFMTLRLAVTGQTATPPLFDVLELLGKDVVERRLKVALPTNSS